MIRRGFLQAGGGSTRFGTDKALVKLAGKTMLQRTGELLAGSCDDVFIVAPAGKYANVPWPVIADRWPGEGPLGGILTALSTMQDFDSGKNWALILSCDMPFLTREFLAFLWDRASLSVAQVLVPQSIHGLEPLCACWNASAATDVQAVFDSGVRKVTEAMKRLPTEVLDESTWKRFDSDGRLFWNMNTPADFTEARHILEAEDR
jgi:molybdopterin-guanine dinucleotide biosynthesis protein A